MRNSRLGTVDSFLSPEPLNDPGSSVSGQFTGLVFVPRPVQGAFRERDTAWPVFGLAAALSRTADRFWPRSTHMSCELTSAQVTVL
jgi:hypothetical protein